MSGIPIASSLADMHLLTVLAETRSFTQAAARLGISKSSVSTRIADLERAAGVALVRRTTRSVMLTEAGRQLVDETQAAFVRIEQSFAGIRDLVETPRGLVRVSAPVALGRQILAPVIAGFLKTYPQICVDLDLSDRFVNLAQEGVDLAIRHTSAPPDALVAWTLCASRSILTASPRYLAERGSPRHPLELSGHSCLLYLRDNTTGNWSFERHRHRARQQRIVVSVSGAMRANNSEVLRAAAMADLGIALLPDFTASDEIQKGNLIPILPDWKPIGFFGDRLYALRPFAARVPRAVQCLVDYLRSELAAPVTA